jgi:hypothetical protein
MLLVVVVLVVALTLVVSVEGVVSSVPVVLATFKSRS